MIVRECEFNHALFPFVRYLNSTSPPAHDASILNNSTPKQKRKFSIYLGWNGWTLLSGTLMFKVFSFALKVVRERNVFLGVELRTLKVCHPFVTLSKLRGWLPMSFRQRCALRDTRVVRYPQFRTPSPLSMPTALALSSEHEGTHSSRPTASRLSAKIR